MCALTVPKYAVFRAGGDQAAHMLAAGFRVTSDADAPGPPQLETTDDFVTRMQVGLKSGTEDVGRMLRAQVT